MQAYNINKILVFTLLLSCISDPKKINSKNSIIEQDIKTIEKTIKESKKFKEKIQNKSYIREEIIYEFNKLQYSLILCKNRLEVLTNDLDKIQNQNNNCIENIHNLEKEVQRLKDKEISFWDKIKNNLFYFSLGSFFVIILQIIVNIFGGIKSILDLLRLRL